MSILLKVRWVDQAEQADPWQRIRHIGGNSRTLRWQHSQDEAIQSIEHGHFTYYVKKDARALKLEIGMANNGRKYLRIPDEVQAQLLSGSPAKTRSSSAVNAQS